MVFFWLHEDLRLGEREETPDVDFYSGNPECRELGTR
jgi:hypothetical protein